MEFGSRRLARWAAAAMLLVQQGCFVDFDPGNTVFACTNDESCASTQQCVDDVCVPRPGQGDADGGTGGAPELIAEYLFNASLDDSSGNGYHAVPYAGSTTYTDGIEGGASLSIDTDNEAKVDFALVSFGALTLETWVRAPESTSTRGFIESPSFTLGLAMNGVVSCAVAGEDAYQSAPGGQMIADEWTHIACTYDPAGALLLYVNGSIAASNAPAGSVLGLEDAVMLIGRSESSVAFEGDIDVLRIWNGVLSEAQICQSAARDDC